MTPHEAEPPPTGTSAHVPAPNVPAAPEVHETSPVGSLRIPVPTSLTVAVQFASSPTRTEAPQLTTVEVGRVPTDTAADPPLPTWFESPS